MAFQITVIAYLQMAYGNKNIKKLFIKLSLRLLASCKLELKNDAIIKSGNTTINVKIIDNSVEVSE